MKRKRKPVLTLAQACEEHMRHTIRKPEVKYYWVYSSDKKTQ